VPLTYVLSADVAWCLAEAVNAQGVEGERVATSPMLPRSGKHSAMCTAKGGVARFLRGARLAPAAGSVAASAGAEQGQKEG